jgi:hypothetical protein
MERLRCFFCGKELSELEVNLLDRPYLRICVTCRNALSYDSFQVPKSKGERRGEGY